MQENEVQWSEQQLASFNKAASSMDSFHIEAVAGSGKTTVLVQIADILGLGKQFLFMAFSKLIATELQRRIPDAEARTLHSMGLSVFKRETGHYRINAGLKSPQYKYLELFRAHLDPVKKKGSVIQKTEFQKLLLEVDQQNEHGAGIYALNDIISKIMITLTPPDVPEAIEDMAETYNIALPIGAEEVSAIATRAIGLGRELAFQKGIVNFDEMIYWPVFEQWESGSYHTVAIDEAQDLNALQHEFLGLIRTNRIISVGDRNQSIFGFAGAMPDSVDKLRAKFNLDEMPLSVCYRCDKDIVRHAKFIVPHIEYHEARGNGKVYQMSPNNIIPNLENGAFILCRLNAPLVSMCFHLINNGIAAKIRGRDVADNLIQTIRHIAQHRGFDISNFPNYLEQYRDREVSKIIMRGGRRQKSLVGQLADKVDCLMNFYDKVMPLSVDHLINEIKALFIDSGNPAVTLMSVHKAKGLEARKVFIIEPQKLPLVYQGQSATEYQQELNLDYVARTRAKNELIYVVNPEV